MNKLHALQKSTTPSLLNQMDQINDLVFQLGSIPLGNVRMRSQNGTRLCDYRISLNGVHLRYQISTEQYASYRNDFERAAKLKTALLQLLQPYPPVLRREILLCVDRMRKKQAAKELASQKQFAEKAVFYTSHGDMVRSKGEVVISEILSSLGLPFQYEKTLKLPDHQTVCPDFTILTFKRPLYIEFCGMTGNSQYDSGLARKKQKYNKNNILENRDILYLFDDEDGGFDVNLIRWQILRFLMVAQEIG